MNTIDHQRVDNIDEAIVLQNSIISAQCKSYYAGIHKCLLNYGNISIKLLAYITGEVSILSLGIVFSGPAVTSQETTVSLSTVAARASTLDSSTLELITQSTTSDTIDSTSTAESSSTALPTDPQVTTTEIVTPSDLPATEHITSGESTPILSSTVVTTSSPGESSSGNNVLNICLINHYIYCFWCLPFLFQPYDTHANCRRINICYNLKLHFTLTLKK